MMRCYVPSAVLSIFIPGPTAEPAVSSPEKDPGNPSVKGNIYDTLQWQDLLQDSSMGIVLEDQDFSKDLRLIRVCQW